MTLPTPEPLDPPTAPAAPVAPDEPTVPLPPEPSPDPSGAHEVDGPTGSAEPEADNAAEQDMVDAIDPGGRPD